MYILYVDESGDPGRYGNEGVFVLAGLVVHENRWQDCFSQVKQLRVTLRQQYEIKRNAELHANRNIAGRGALWGQRWTVEERVRLFQIVLETISQMPAVRTLSVCIRKDASQLMSARGRDIHDTAWTFLLQRFHNFIERAGNANDCGMVVHDSGHEVEIRRLMRKLRAHNYVPSRYGSARNIPLTRLIEDPVPRDSRHAQFIQLADFIAYCVLRHEVPVTKYRGLATVYGILRPVALREVSKGNDLGIVYYPHR